jgi:hypothetical protein
MHEIRHALRGEGVVLMGKNTMVWESTVDEVRKLTPAGSPSNQRLHRR